MPLKAILTDLSFRCVSDVVEELDAAQQARLHTCGLVLEGGELAGHPAVAGFDAIDPRRY